MADVSQFPDKDVEKGKTQKHADWEILGQTPFRGLIMNSVIFYLFSFLWGTQWDYKSIPIKEVRPSSEASSQTMTHRRCDRGRQRVIVGNFW